MALRLTHNTEGYKHNKKSFPIGGDVQFFVSLFWHNSFIHRPVGIAPCSPTGRRTRENPTGKCGVPGKSFMVGTLALP
jgi:hypothetical protein